MIINKTLPAEADGGAHGDPRMFHGGSAQICGLSRVFDILRFLLIMTKSKSSQKIDAKMASKIVSKSILWRSGIVFVL